MSADVGSGSVDLARVGFLFVLPIPPDRGDEPDHTRDGRRVRQPWLYHIDDQVDDEPGSQVDAYRFQKSHTRRPYSAWLPPRGRDPTLRVGPGPVTHETPKRGS